jgi:hypothetical protein
MDGSVVTSCSYLLATQIFIEWVRKNIWQQIGMDDEPKSTQ